MLNNLMYFIYRKGTLKFEKESDYGPSKIAVYSTIVWAEATLQFDEWKECFKDDKPVKRLVHGDYYFISSIWDRNQVRYSGIHCLNAKGEIVPRTGLNLDNYEWINVMKKVEEINVALYGAQAAKGEKRNPSDIQVWSYNCYVNGEIFEVDGDEMQYFREADAKREGEAQRPELTKKMKLKKQDKLEMKVVCQYVERPSEVMQMRAVLHYCVKLCLFTYRNQKCSACQGESPAPDQASHMVSGGCLDEFDLTREDVAFVMNVIKPEDLAMVYNMVCRFLGVSPAGSQLLAQGIMSWISQEDVVNTLNEDAHDEEGLQDEMFYDQNRPLLRLIQEVYHDVNMHAILEKRVADKMAVQADLDKKLPKKTTPKYVADKAKSK